MVKHVLADGRRLESIDGYVIPSIGRSEVVYRIIKRVHAESEQQEIENQNANRTMLAGGGIRTERVNL